MAWTSRQQDTMAIAIGKEGHSMAQTTHENVTLTAPDISCGHCVNSIQNRIGGLEGVDKVVASVETKHVDLSFDPSKVSLDTIKAEMEDEGYPVQD